MKAATPMMVALRNDPLASAVEVQYFQQDGHSSHSPLSTESSPPVPPPQPQPLTPQDPGL